MENLANDFFHCLQQYENCKKNNFINVYLCYNNITEKFIVTVFFSKSYILAHKKFLDILK